MSATSDDSAFEQRTFAKIAWRIVPLLFIGYVVAFLDRVNVGFAKLQMASDLQFSDAVYGFGAGIFFISYLIFEVPSNLVLRKVGARLWLARIMITWGIISGCFMFTGMVAWGGIASAFGCTDAEFTFYVLRFLLGIAEAGFYPGAVYYLTLWFPARRRAHATAAFMTAVAASNLIGSPISGAILQWMDGVQNLRGWQWLFVIEAIPSVLVGIVYILFMSDGPQKAKWLSSEERDLIHRRIAEEETEKGGAIQTVRGAFADWRLWALTAIYFSGAVPFYALAFWLPTLVQEVSGGDYFTVGLISMIPWAFTIIFQVLMAQNSDRTGERRLHIAFGFVCICIGVLMLAMVDNSPVLSLTGMSLIMAGSLSYSSIFWSLPTAIMSGAAAAASIAFINSVGQIGGYLGPDLVGRVRTANNGDIDGLMYVLAAGTLVGIALLLFAPIVRKNAVR
jgi:MFS family permease